MAQHPGGRDSFHPSASYEPASYQNSDTAHERTRYDDSSIYEPYSAPPPPLSMPDSSSSMPNGYPPPSAPSTQSSSGPPYSQPIADAVNYAFDNSAAAHQVPSEVIAQITEQVRNQVIDSLRKELSGSQPQQTYYNPPQTQQPPYPATNGATHMPMPSAAPAPPFSPVQPSGLGPVPPLSNMSQPDPQFYGSSPPKSERTAHTPPTPDKDADEANYFRSNTARDRASYPRYSRDEASSEKRHSTMSASPVRTNTIREDLSSRYGERTREGTFTDRPTTTRMRTDEEETVVEKMWQPLFDAEGKPTARLNQFLRGIALHLIEEYEPKQSLVVGPRKMKKFFDQMKLGEELFSWKDIFCLPTPQLSALYTLLSCQHHLIPRSTAPFEAPTLAALTPHGFAAFMTVIIQAHPSHEFHRLAATVKNWPVSNADERKERWPKELSRRLLPKKGSDSERRKLYDALRKAGMPAGLASVPPPPSQPPPPMSAPPQGYSSSTTSAYPPPPPPTAAPSHNHSSSFSRPHRNSYMAPPQPSQPLQDDPEDISDDSSGPSIPLERERKPYVAKEGTGKIYDDNLTRTKSTSEVPNARPIPQATHRDSMSSTMASSGTYHYSSSGPNNMPPPRARDRTAAETFGGRASYTPKPKTTNDRSPPYGRGSGQLDGTGSTYAPKYEEDERYYNDRDHERLDRVSSRDEEHHRDRRYSKYDDDYTSKRLSGYAGVANSYTGNPPLGTGERRY